MSYNIFYTSKKRVLSSNERASIISVEYKQHKIKHYSVCINGAGVEPPPRADKDEKGLRTSIIYAHVMCFTTHTRNENAHFKPYNGCRMLIKQKRM